MAADLKKILIQQLEEKGIQLSQIPGFLRDLENTLLDDPDISLFQVSSHLQSLGWDDIQLDYHTFQLACESITEGRE